MRNRLPLLLTLGFLAGVACAQADATPMDGERQPVHTDSVFPIEEEIRRFHAGLPAVPVDLDAAAAATSRDELVDRFVNALEEQDTAVFQALALDRSEFAYLYYPSTHYTRPPYELSPALLWFQIQQASEKGIRRALRTFGGRSLGPAGYSCPDSGVVEGRNRLWGGCILRLQGPDGSETEVRLFGTILERDGRFKFLSYANDL